MNLFDLPKHIHSRSITHENRDGAAGVGGQANSPLGPGRKGSPAVMIPPGETFELADITGPGMIRHIWVATYSLPEVFRSLTVRIYWDDQPHPSVEAPLGDFFGFAHGQVKPYGSAVHSIGEKGALNIWLPMPFLRRARIAITNELPIAALFFYQIDFTLGDALSEDVGRLHVLFRREAPTRTGEDFELLPKRGGPGRFLGSVIGVRPIGPHWWGEGEVKMFLDGDDEFPTLVGTGAEDYVGLGWNVQENTYPFNGASLVERSERAQTAGPVSMYRWHLVDPVYWQRSARITIQQIGVEITPQTAPKDFDQYLSCLREREDDWSCCSFWYQAFPSEPLPSYPVIDLRLHDLPRHEDLSTLPLQPGFTTEDQLQTQARTK